MENVECEHIQSQKISDVNLEQGSRKSQKPKNLGIDLAPQLLENLD